MVRVSVVSTAVLDMCVVIISSIRKESGEGIIIEDIFIIPYYLSLSKTRRTSCLFADAVSSSRPFVKILVIIPLHTIAKV